MKTKTRLADSQVPSGSSSCRALIFPLSLKSVCGVVLGQKFPRVSMTQFEEGEIAHSLVVALQSQSW